MNTDEMLVAYKIPSSRITYEGTEIIFSREDRIDMLCQKMHRLIESGIELRRNLTTQLYESDMHADHVCSLISDEEFDMYEDIHWENDEWVLSQIVRPGKYQHTPLGKRVLFWSSK